ncbi:MAG: hypothetical protein ACI802_002719 [Candidatus Paceibacteria bacterium]
MRTQRRRVLLIYSCFSSRLGYPQIKLRNKCYDIKKNGYYHVLQGLRLRDLNALLNQFGLILAQRRPGRTAC